MVHEQAETRKSMTVAYMLSSRSLKLCQFSCTKIVFLGHVIDGNDILPDLAKQKDEATTNKCSRAEQTNGYD